MPRMLTALLALLVLSGCTTEAKPTPEGPQRVSWQRAELPMPPGPEGRIAVRDAVRCQNEWYVVGGVFGADGESRPAGWRSEDGRTWTSLRFKPRWYWAHRNVVSAVACRDGQVAMVGGKSGGAHGNPRVSTWYPRQDGVFTDVIAAFELYGGPRAVNVGRIAAGDPGWMIVGNRMSGAAVWTSKDATDFSLVDSDPQLASDPTVDTSARDVVYTAGSWTVVGSGLVKGQVAQVPMAWVSADGTTWERQEVRPHGKGYADLQRVAPYRDGVMAAGIDGEAFAVWRRNGTRWRRLGHFGEMDASGSASAFISGLTVAGSGVVAAVSDGARYGLWASPDGNRWREVTVPV
ncbi:MAG TPA: hypothetical protein VHJ83_16230, partial [Micromonosporaceae bacterium]|nr:hypothetical protein [Micromonosporaceae bacterium]